MTASVCFTFAEVAGYGLAEDVFGGGEVEDVIDDLEGETKVAAVFAELRFQSRHRSG